ncbi:hypothetical protein [Streptomyces shenzhenensis]|uniref:hypothetical protein n=1 Tax=Streptomyces shenzhenensis TaxID=943815 RepID=UPI0036AA3EAB
MTGIAAFIILVTVITTILCGHHAEDLPPVTRARLRHRRTDCACLTGAVLTATAGTCAADGNPWLIALSLYTAVLLAWYARRSYAAHCRQDAEADWESRRVLVERPDPLNPCCLLAHHSRGAAHNRRCTDGFHRIVASFAAEPWSNT